MTANGMAVNPLVKEEFLQVGGWPTYVLKSGTITDRLLFLIIPGKLIYRTWRKATVTLDILMTSMYVIKIEDLFMLQKRTCRKS